MPPPLSFPPAQFRSQPLSLSLSLDRCSYLGPRYQCPLPTTERYTSLSPHRESVVADFTLFLCITRDTRVSDPMNSEIDQFKCVVYRGEKKRSLEEEGLVVRIVLNRRLDDRLSISDRVDRRPWPGWTEENYIASKSPIFSPSFFPLY